MDLHIALVIASGSHLFTTLNQLQSGPSIHPFLDGLKWWPAIVKLPLGKHRKKLPDSFLLCPQPPVKGEFIDTTFVIFKEKQEKGANDSSGLILSHLGTAIFQIKAIDILKNYVDQGAIVRSDGFFQARVPPFDHRLVHFQNL
tara:strand:- start:1752 stop:2180 length:429 start_codon:yes stop_codon:yes gene_type:complete